MSSITGIKHSSKISQLDSRNKKTERPSSVSNSAVKTSPSVEKQQAGLHVKAFSEDKQVSRNEHAKDTAKLSTNTTQKQAEFQISREQASNMLEQDLIRNVFKQAKPLTSEGTGAIQKAAITAADKLDHVTVLDAAKSRFQLRGTENVGNSMEKANLGSVPITLNITNTKTTSTTAKNLDSEQNKKAINQVLVMYQSVKKFNQP